ncbi:MAG: acyl-CoA dehydrogenase family protein [Dehalococcoidia bacterium]
MDLELSEEQRLIVETVRRFVIEQIVPLERDMDPDATELPREEKVRLQQMTRSMGFFNPDVPVEFGGAGMDTTTRTLMAEEMSQHRAGLYTPCYGVFGAAALAQLYSGTEEQKQKYLYPALSGEKHGFFGLSEPSGGSDPARAIRTTAVRDGDEWVINGSKLWISGADTSDYGLLFVRTDASKGRNGITCFIVDTDTPGFEVRRIVHVLRSTHPPTELSFDNMRVPHANILGEEGGGFAIANDRLSRNRIPYTAECIGVAVASQRMAVAWSKERVTFGEPLASRQAIQWMLVDNEIDIATSRWLALAAASKADQDQPFRTEAAMCKLVGTESSGRVVDRCIQIHGGLGVSKDLPLERWYREIRIRRIGEGPSEVQRIIMARDLLHASLR